MGQLQIIVNLNEYYYYCKNRNNNNNNNNERVGDLNDWLVKLFESNPLRCNAMQIRHWKLHSRANKTQLQVAKWVQKCPSKEAKATIYLLCCNKHALVRFVGLFVYVFSICLLTYAYLVEQAVYYCCHCTSKPVSVLLLICIQNWNNATG